MSVVLAWFVEKGGFKRVKVECDAQGAYAVPPLPRKPGLSVAAYPPGTDHILWCEGRDPYLDDGTAPIGWHDVPPGLPTLDLTLDSSLGLKPYPSR